MTHNIALITIAACMLANTVAIYTAEGGGSNICAGVTCYHIGETK